MFNKIVYDPGHLLSDTEIVAMFNNSPLDCEP
jgi:hypothetical protein